MKKSFDDISNKEVGKIAIVSGLGPSLSLALPDITWMNKHARKKVAFFNCNLFDLMTDLDTDYWIVANSQPIMMIEQAHKRYNAQKDSTFIFASRIPGFQENLADDLLEINYIPMKDDSNLFSLPHYLQSYCSHDSKYGAVYSVAVHMIAVAIITGCKKIYISGVDLDYSKGYVKDNVHPKGVALGKRLMGKDAIQDTINKIEYLKSCAKKVGSELYSLNPTGVLSKILEYKDIKEVRKEMEIELS
jgi:hypothetical protein